MLVTKWKVMHSQNWLGKKISHGLRRKSTKNFCGHLLIKKSRFIGYIDNVKIYRDLIYSMTTNATFIFGHRQADYSLLCQLPTLIPFGETEWLTKNLEYPT